MDTTYLKMCDCPEIQEQWKRESGDWFYAKEDLGDGNDRKFITKGAITCSGDIGDFSWGNSCDFSGGIENFNDAVWLPRQDQLQEMISVEEYPYTLVEKFGVWFDAHNNSDEQIDYESMEQLWIAFYMKEKHGKVWSDGKWC